MHQKRDSYLARKLPHLRSSWAFRWGRIKAAVLNMSVSQKRPYNNPKEPTQPESDKTSNKQLPAGKQKRSRMQLISNTLLIFAGIAALVVSGLFYYHKQTAACWVTFGGVMALALAGCLQWQDSIWKQKEEAAKAQAQSKAADKPVPQTAPTADRPWLTVEATPFAPLVFSEDGAKLRVRFIVRNVGSNVANGAKINSSIFIPKAGGDVYHQANERRDVLCKDAAFLPIGNTLFPRGEPLIWDMTFGIGRQEMEDARIASSDLVLIFIVGMRRLPIPR